MFDINFTKYADKKTRKLIEKDRSLQKILINCLETLAESPFDASLKTHKVNSRKFGIAYSSRLTGDLRIIWDFDGSEIVFITIQDIGGHSGGQSVY
jgi:mRNA-degrading endonuclease YafQ of YafQ-DinJ toxin-antitoxin module